MSRILLGVSGGIAAYKALEVVRLATGAGHSVRVVQTPSAPALRGPRLLRGAERRAGARERVRARPRARRLPRPAAAGARRRSATSSSCANADLYLIAPGLGEHDREARARPRRQPLTSAALAATLPARAGAGDEQPHVRARRRRRPTCDLLRERGVTRGRARRGQARLAGEHGIGRLRRAGAAAAGVRAAARRRETWNGVRVLVSAGGTREPIDACASSATRSSGRMGLALAAAARARGAEVTVRRRQRRAAAARGRALPRGGHAPRSCQRPAREEFPACDVLLMAAAVADFRPVEPRRRSKLKKSEQRAAHARARAHDRRAEHARRAPRRRPDARRVRRRARRGGGRVRARQARAQGPRRGRRQRRLAQRTRASRSSTTRSS